MPCQAMRAATVIRQAIVSQPRPVSAATADLPALADRERVRMRKCLFGSHAHSLRARAKAVKAEVFPMGSED